MPVHIGLRKKICFEIPRIFDLFYLHFYKKNIVNVAMRMEEAFYTISIRGIRTITKFRLLTKIDFNVMHLVILCKIFWQKLQIRGSSDLLNSLLYPASILALQVQGIQIWLFCNFFTFIDKFSWAKSIRGIFTAWYCQKLKKCVWNCWV